MYDLTNVIAAMADTIKGMQESIRIKDETIAGLLDDVNTAKQNSKMNSEEANKAWITVHELRTQLEDKQAQIDRLESRNRFLPDVDSADFSGYWRNEMIQILRTSYAMKKINGIKFIRAFTGWGLLEAKNFYEDNIRDDKIPF